METATRLVQRFVEELWNDRRMDTADEIIAPECVTHQLRSGAVDDATARGPKAVREHVAGWLASFPDLRFTVEQMLTQGDRIATQLFMTGTHRGTWLGMPPTGKTVQIRMFTIHRVANGKIVEDWVLVESLGFFQQLGVLPPTDEILRGFVHRPEGGAQ